jgi:hypothetical protein
MNAPTGQIQKTKYSRTCRNCRLLVTSRPHVDLSSYFETHRVDIRTNEADVEKYIVARLEKYKRLNRYIDANKKQAIVRGIIGKCDGM